MLAPLLCSVVAHGETGLASADHHDLDVLRIHEQSFLL
jgi:hypothetical protein